MPARSFASRGLSLSTGQVTQKAPTTNNDSPVSMTQPSRNTMMPPKKLANLRMTPLFLDVLEIPARHIHAEKVSNPAAHDVVHRRTLSRCQITETFIFGLAYVCREAKTTHVCFSTLVCARDVSALGARTDTLTLCARYTILPVD